MVVVCLVAISLIALLALFIFYLRRKQQKLVVFFHPYCLDGGGGEKVLWEAIEAIKDKTAQIAIYSADADRETAKTKLLNQFRIELPDNVNFINVGKPLFLAPGYFKSWTLLMQAIYSIPYAIKCLLKCVPSVIIETTGAPFCIPIFKIFGGCKVIAYTHYPFISTDMIQSVEDKKESFNNRKDISSSALKTKIKKIYYRIMAFVYSKAGRFPDLIMVNSTWTCGHISQIFKRKAHIVYPPCDIESFSKFPFDGREEGLILSIGQFRPEKRLPLQVDIMADVVKQNPKAHLVIAGGCRNANDEKLRDDVQAKINELGLQDKITLKPNVPFDELKDLLRRAQVGLHTMYNEHFGICVVEYIAAGLVPVSNKSAGPLLDIVCDERYLALEKDEYATKVLDALNDNNDTRKRFREHAEKFSNEEFRRLFAQYVVPSLV